MPTITFTEAVGGPVPAVEIEIHLTGSGGLPSGEQIRNVVIIAERVAAGTQTVDTISATPIGSRDDGIANCGANSPGAAMVAALYDHYNSESGAPKCNVWTLPVTEKATGTAPIQTLTVAGGTNTAAGIVTLAIGGHLFPVSIPNSTIVNDQAILIAAAFNNADQADKPPLVATTPGAGVVTFTGSVKCAHMNNIGLRVVSQGSILVSTYTWSSTTMGGAGVGGTPGVGGLLAADLATALAALLVFTDADQYVIPWTENGTTAAKFGGNTFNAVLPTAFRAHIITKANATNMIPTSLRMAWKSNVAKAVAAVGTLDTNDTERISLAVVGNVTATGVSTCGQWEGEIAARYAGLRATERHYGRSLDGLKMPGLENSLPADNFTAAECKTLLEGGCTPIWVPAFSSDMELCRDVACRMDFGVLDTMAMDALDYIRSDFAATLNAQRRMSIVADDADLPPVDFITQPKVVKGLLRSRADALAKAGYMTNVATNWPNVTVNLSGSTLQLALPIDLIPALHNVQVRMDATVPAGV